MDSYSGSSSYKYIDRLISKSRKELLVISPYITDYYIKMLIRKRKRAKIITSESSAAKGTIIGSLDKAYAKNYATWILYFAALFLILYYIGIFAFATLSLSACIAIAALLTYRYFKGTISPIKVKVIKGVFVHEKLYIGDNEAIVGSANMTYSGTHRNIEHIEVISDSNEIKKLRRHFYELWDSN
ncbi:MAG: phospholipase D-like domain-containing protein [Candidatus Micrarchaeia archaeon]